MHRILIANRGLSALKFILSINDWEIQDTKPYKLIGFVNEDDMKSKYKYINLVDEIIYAENDIYTNIDQIIIYCKEYNIDAVWPGWGYLSENEEFAKALNKNNIIFIGPSADCLHQLGDKLMSMKLAKELNIPVLAWSGEKPLKDITEIRKFCNTISYPVMLKAVDGGGGKGIREVKRDSDLQEKYDEVVKEVSSNIFVMKKAENCFHLEVQIVGDGEDAIHLYGRDCTVQRRNQKLIEEGPITKAPEIIVQQMYKDAVNIAKKVKYRGVGTAEFLYEPSSNTYTFLEINPRLQVEHIITEFVCNVNIPKIQVLLAEGYKICEIDELQDISIKKYVMSARINAENPYDNFQPSCGKVNSIELLNLKDSWSYFSIENNGTILQCTDSQMGHIFSIGNSRDQVRKKLIKILENLKIDGQVFNSGKFIKNVIRNDSFIHQNHYTTWLHEIDLNCLDSHISIVPEIINICYAIIKTYPIFEDELKQFRSLTKKGHFPKDILSNPYNIEIIFKNYKNIFNVYYSIDEKLVLIEFNEKIYKVYINVIHNSIYIMINDKIYQSSINNETYKGSEIIINNNKYWFNNIIDSSIFKSNISGKVSNILCEQGQQININDPYIEIEVMKMIIKLHASENGKITYKIKNNTTVNVGDILAQVETLEKTNTIKYESYNDLPLKEQSIDIKNRFINNIEDYKKKYSYTETTADQNKVILPKNIISRDLVKKDINTTWVHYIPYYFDPKNINQLFINTNVSENASIINQIIISDEIKYDNQIGMVAWLLELKRPEISIIVISNDITYKVGSFGYNEDLFFKKISEFSRIKKIPRIYISCNSGAQLSVNVGIKDKFKIYWIDNNISNGLDFFYLDEEDYQDIKDEIVSERIFIDKLNKYVFKIKGIYNNGVKNLDGSSIIASETAKSYKENLTFTYITGRSVGIGAYLAKLGERVIQKIDSPILLTGYSALNSLIGKKAYDSNLQIGGPEVMSNNGISHKLVKSDQEGILTIINWLSYINFNNYSPRKELIISPHEFIPSGSGYNIKDLLNSLLDKNEFFELMENWAPSIITGRGKIGGLPLGIIAANNVVSYKNTPADPADPSSEISNKMQSPCVLYPDSSLKFSQTVNDLKNENLPILIIANWRGFSGGTTDMYNDILRCGSSIVNALESYKNPIFIYLPPYSQLRGGAMVVMSKGINPECISFYSDPTARINILEPSGYKTIKFKETELIKIMERNMDEINPENISIYDRVILDYVDLHDIPEIGFKNNIIDNIVDCFDSRKFFYNKLVDFYSR